MVGERLVGLARVLDDSELVAFVHYVLVHPEYQGQKIAGNMVEYIRDKYKNYLYKWPSGVQTLPCHSTFSL
jgi:GNAT superfamily N-acetyltransferase